MSNYINKPKASFLITAYNESRYISKCLTSLLDQSYSNFEIIIINDGSTDNTSEIIKKFKDNRIILIEQKNYGRVISRNKLMNLAKGKYVIFQDADDWSEKDRLELLLSVAENNSKKPVIGSNYIIHDEIKNKISHRTFNENNINIRRKMNRRFMSNSMFPPSILMLRSHLISLGGWREKFDIACEDGDLLDRIFEDDNVFFYNIKKPLYHYRLNAGSVTNKADLTIPYQIFKRKCKNLRRSGLEEPLSFQEFIEQKEKTFFSRLKYNIEFYSWIRYKKYKKTI